MRRIPTGVKVVSILTTTFFFWGTEATKRIQYRVREWGVLKDDDNCYVEAKDIPTKGSLVAYAEGWEPGIDSGRFACNPKFPVKMPNEPLFSAYRYAIVRATKDHVMKACALVLDQEGEFNGGK